MQPTSFDSGFIVTWLRLIWARLRESLFTPEHIVYTAMQMPALVGTGFTAWWIYDFVHPRLSQRIQARTTDEHGRHTLLVLASLLFPLL